MSESLRNLSTIEYGASPKEIRSNDSTSIGIYGTGGLVGSATKPLFHGPLVVVARKGTLDKPFFITGDCWVIDTAYAVLPNANVDAKWLYYNLLKYDLKKLNESTGVPSISRDYLYRVTFETFPLPEQRKIARILSNVDAVIEKSEAAIAKYKAIKSGMMRDLFTRGIDLKTGKLRPRYEDAPELYKQSELGWIPKEWDVVKIGDFSSIKGGKRLPAGREFSDSETPFPYLRVTDMVDGSIDQSNLKYVPIEIEPIIRSYKISTKDIYVTIAGTLGLFGTIPENLDNAQLTENAAKITDYDSSQFERDYIKHQCASAIIQSQINREIGVGGGVPKLALFRIARFLFFKPNIKEQSVIVSRINKADNLIRKEITGYNKEISIKQALMSDLLTGKVQVKYEKETAEEQ